MKHNAKSTSSISPQIDTQAIEAFFTTLYPTWRDTDRLVLSVARQKGLSSTWVSPGDHVAAVNFFKRHSGSTHTYFGVCLMHERFYKGNGSRGRTEAATAVTGLWADIDIASGTHAESALPPTKQDAIQLVYDALKFPKAALMPSLVVFTGGGIHVYWLFRQSYSITTDEDRKFIHGLSVRLNRHIHAVARERGWKVDSVGDLPRVLRVPGTPNKYKPAQMILYASGALSRSDFHP